MWLHVRSGPDVGTAVELPAAAPFVLGRQRGSDLVVRGSRASRRHAELTPQGEDRWLLRDLESANGTYVDGTRVTETTLEGGEDIKIGDVVLSVTRRGPADTGATVAPPPAVTDQTPLGQTDLAPQLATHSMVRRLVDAGARRASRRGLVAGAGAAVVVIVVLLLVGVIGGSEDAVPKVVAKLRPSTVLVTTERGDVLTGTGSGWVLDAGQGLIVTNGHVVNQGDTFTVTADGRSRPASVAGVAPCEDLALLRVADRSELVTARLAPRDSVRQGETVVAMGFPADAAAGDEPGSTRGVVSAGRTTFKDPAPDVPAYPNVLQTDTPLNPGNSGGPLVDLDARVVGVDSAARTSGSDGRALQNVNYAITIDHARQVLADLRAGRAAAWTGFTFGYPTDADLRQSKLPPGLRVTGAIPGTPAAQAGIEPGSLLAGIDGKAIANTLRSYCAAVPGRTTGDEVTLNFARPGAAETRAVKLRLG
ncbi:MAG: putative serine protease PepD [Solirubrobacteraceae bacterium]|nr:putative serine protease PepD [Solirubrobacteraceae bacterium]